MILVNNPGDWGHIFSPLEHASWHGCTPTELVFPFFLFAVGNSMAIVFQRSEYQEHRHFLRRTFRRTLMIFLIGLFLNWFPFIRWEGSQLVFKYWVSPENPDYGIRILGVLQRIAICYLFSAILIHFIRDRRNLWILSTAILLSYWLICVLCAQNVDPFSMDGFFGLALDKHVLGISHMYKGEGRPFDPEGIGSSLPAIVQPVIGWIAGNYLVRKGKNYETLVHLLIAGFVLVFIGYSWDLFFPINKKIWSSSFVLYTSGIAILVLSLLMWIYEFMNFPRRWVAFFLPFGKNPLFIFVLSGLIPRLLALFRWHVSETVFTSPLPWLYKNICKPVFSSPEFSSLLYAIVMVFFYWTIAYWLDRKRVYIKV